MLRTFYFLFILFLTTIAVSAQQFTSLRGSVTDQSGATIPGANVSLVNSETGLQRSIVTKNDGTYQFEKLMPGTYSIRIEQNGFKTIIQENLLLLVASAATVDIKLEIGDVNESVTVDSTSVPIINTNDATRGNAILEEEIKRLPFVARNPVNLLTLQPGVVFTGVSDSDRLFSGVRVSDLREGTVNGVRGNQSNITVDGIDANDFELQTPFSSTLPLTLDSVQEFRVITTNSDASYGISGGAQVSIVTKSGSNNFSGNLREYHRNTSTSANSFFNNSAGIKRPKLLRNIFGGSLGGRIIRDRLFFFLEIMRDGKIRVKQQFPELFQPKL